MLEKAAQQSIASRGDGDSPLTRNNPVCMFYKMKLLLTHMQPKISKMKRSERQFHNFPKHDSVKRGCNNELWGLTRQTTCLIS